VGEMLLIKGVFFKSYTNGAVLDAKPSTIITKELLWFKPVNNLRFWTDDTDVGTTLDDSIEFVVGTKLDIGFDNSEGYNEGIKVGSDVEQIVGSTVGFAVELVGTVVGIEVGLAVGDDDEGDEGLSVGIDEGSAVEQTVGDTVGELIGKNVGDFVKI